MQTWKTVNNLWYAYLKLEQCERSIFFLDSVWFEFFPACALAHIFFARLCNTEIVSSSGFMGQKIYLTNTNWCLYMGFFLFVPFVSKYLCKHRNSTVRMVVFNVCVCIVWLCVFSGLPLACKWNDVFFFILALVNLVKVFDHLKFQMMEFIESRSVEFHSGMHTAKQNTSHLTKSMKKFVFRMFTNCMNIWKGCEIVRYGNFKDPKNVQRNFSLRRDCGKELGLGCVGVSPFSGVSKICMFQQNWYAKLLLGEKL